MPEMKIGVRKKTGIAFLYHEDTPSRKLRELGIRPATEEEIRKYYELKPLFEAHKIDKIQLGEPESSSTWGSYMPAEFPFPPLPKKFTGRAIKVVTVPGGSRWRCSLCGRDLAGGEPAGKLGKIILCTECVRKGK